MYNSAATCAVEIMPKVCVIIYAKIENEKAREKVKMGG